MLSGKQGPDSNICFRREPIIIIIVIPHLIASSVLAESWMNLNIYLVFAPGFLLVLVLGLASE